MRPGIDPKVDYAFKKLFSSVLPEARAVLLGEDLPAATGGGARIPRAETDDFAQLPRQRAVPPGGCAASPLRLGRSRTQLRLTDELAIHIVELQKFVLPPEELSTPLDLWCYFLRHGETLDTASLPTALDKPIIHRAMEVLNVLTQTDLERERYEATGIPDAAKIR